MKTHSFAARNPRFSHTICFVLITAGIANNAIAADGEFDQGFGLSGTVNHVEVMPANLQAQALHHVASQVFPDGTVAISGTRPHRVSKFLLNGDPDPEFGVAGTTPDLAGNLGEAGTNFIRTDDGRIFTIAFKSDAPATGVVLCQFSSTGLPQNFTAGGTPCVEHLVQEAQQPVFWPQDLGIDTAGGIVVVTRDARIVRFNPDGSVDETLDNEGIYDIEPAGVIDLNHVVEDMQIVGDAIFLTGWLDNNAVEVDGIVHKLRLTPPSAASQQTQITRDPEFNEGTYKLVDCAAQTNWVCQLRSLTIRDSEVILAGSGQHDGLYGAVLTLNSQTGEQEGATSILTATATPETRVELKSIAAQSNGDVVVAGTLQATLEPNSYDEVFVARLMPGCANPSDPAFGTNGWTSFTYAVDGFSKGTSISIGDGRLYVAGHTHWNMPIIESVSALVNNDAFSDSIFADDFELTCVE